MGEESNHHLTLTWGVGRNCWKEPFRCFFLTCTSSCIKSARLILIKFLSLSAERTLDHSFTLTRGVL